MQTVIKDRTLTNLQIGGFIFFYTYRGKGSEGKTKIKIFNTLQSSLELTSVKE